MGAYTAPPLKPHLASPNAMMALNPAIATPFLCRPKNVTEILF
jgi:hypothetical protein